MPEACFLCGKKQIIQNGKSILCVDHKVELLTGKKDKMSGDKLYRYISKCNEKNLDKYQILCDECNLMKEHVYEMLAQLKNKGNIDEYNALLDLYNHTLITSKLKNNKHNNNHNEKNIKDNQKAWN